MILKYPHPKLRKKAKKVAQITPKIKKIIQKMQKTITINEGAGLAANQIGELIRVICYFDNEKLKFLINPVIVKKSKDTIEAEEGCLSFPNLFGRVIRPAKIKVKGLNKFGKKQTIKAENMIAVALQHEIDHLDGVLFIDKVIPGTLEKIVPKKAIQAAELKNKIIFCGTSEFSVKILEKLNRLSNLNIKAIITECEKPAGRNQKICPSPVKMLAQKLNLKIYEPQKISEIESKIKKINPELIIVTAYGQIIPENILKIPKRGLINIHPSLLPKYRGPSPIQSALLKGDQITGVTIMQMDQKMDTGPILAQQEVKISPNDNFISLSKKLAQNSAKLLEKTIIDYLGFKIKPIPQDNSHATYCVKINKKDGVLDFTKSAQELENQIKAFAVWPKSYCFWGGRRIIIIDAEATKDAEETRVAKGTEEAEDTKDTKDRIGAQAPMSFGSVYLDKNSQKLAILTAKGNLIINKLQLEGKKILSSQEFLNGHPEIINQVLKSKAQIPTRDRYA